MRQDLNLYRPAYSRSPRQIDQRGQNGWYSSIGSPVSMCSAGRNLCWKRLWFNKLIVTFLSDIEDTEEDRCSPERCRNGGRCIQTQETLAVCECEIGFIGKYCEEHIIPALNFLHHDPGICL